MILTETERLIIRTWEESDIEKYHQLVSDPDVMKYINKGETLTLADAEKYVRSCIQNYQEHRWSRFVVEIKKTNEFAGFCGYKFYNNEPDFGWRYAQSFWGKGIGLEGAQAVLNIGLTIFNFERIVCIVHPENYASARIIEKLGFQFEKTISINDQKLLQFSNSNNQC